MGKMVSFYQLKLNKRLPYTPAIPFLRNEGFMSPKNMYTNAQRETSFVTVLNETAHTFTHSRTDNLGLVTPWNATRTDFSMSASF